jgi:DNA mismatch repair protein MutS2
MKTVQAILEIPLILERIQPYAKTVLGQHWIMDDTFIPAEFLKQKAQEVEEMMRLIARYQVLPIVQSHDLTPLLGLLAKGSVIPLEGLGAIALDLLTIEKILSFVITLKPDFPQLASLWKGLMPLKPIQQLFHKTLTQQGTIRDDASTNLLSIRRKLKAMDAQMLVLIQQALSKYSQHLTEPLYTLKNGRYVLPVATSSKAAVPGMIHDVSSTGLTTFIEPKTLVDLSLEKQLLLGEEQEEIFTILKSISDQLRPEIPALTTNNQRIGYLDLIGAKAQFGIATQGFIGELSQTPLIEIKGARHPLIDPDKVVKNDFLITEKKAIVIISGPNAGGKTVAMKTVGLFVYLHQLAIPLPTSEPARLAYFKHLYADIGDQQSMLENLSTFAAHIQNLVPLTEQVKPFDLVLIDELGTGTDPKEGEALARSLLIHLQAKRAFVIVSSHFPGLKTLALEEPHMVNASLQFDEEKLMPTYRFLLGMPGKSYGLIMAKRYGLAPQVVGHAEKYLANMQSTFEQKTLHKLQEELQQIELLKASLSTQQKNLEEQLLTIAKERKQLQSKQQDFERNTQSQQTKLLAETLEKVEATIKALANPDLKLHQAIALKQSLNDLLKQPEENEPMAISEALQVGDYVKETTTLMVGKITQMTKQNVMIITRDGLTLKVKRQDVEKTQPPATTTSTKPLRLIQSSKAPSSINIIGLRYEEAKLAVEKYYDLALLSSLKTLKIIHGFGSGTLRQMVYDYFKSLNTVKTIQQGEGEQAGYGVTIIHLL